MSLLWQEVMTERRRSRSEQKQVEDYLELNGDNHGEGSDEPDTDHEQYWL
jgi:hypothetical protein